MHARPTRAKASEGESRFSHRLRMVSLSSVVAGVTAFALMFGLQPWVVVAATFGLQVASVKRAASKRVEELFEKPDVQLVVGRNDSFHGSVLASTPSPWPVNSDRVVANEVNASVSTPTRTRTWPVSPSAPLPPLSFRLSAPPSPQEYDRVRATFDGEFHTYEDDLREWLRKYAAVAERRSRTFQLDLRIFSSKRGAYAERVTLAIELSNGMELATEWPTVALPPQSPAYVAPRRRSVRDDSPLRIAMPRFATPITAPLMTETASIWQPTDGGRRVETNVGDIHHGRLIELTQPLPLRVWGEGRHEARWTMFIKNCRRPVTGSFSLMVPGPTRRPAFTRLHGIESFPDAPFVDENQTVMRTARTTDPSTSPPALTIDDGPFGRLRHGFAQRAWLALGLDSDEGDGVDAGDRPSRRIEVGGAGSTASQQPSMRAQDRG